MGVSFGTKRSFLFLQGISSPFFVRLAREIAESGHSVHRVNICGGDRVFWPRLGAVDFRGRFSDWRKFLGAYLHDSGVTDVILFGDCRPYHRVAVDLARSRSITVHVFEEGYFRPDWITLERDGTNAYSNLPRDPRSVQRAAKNQPAGDLTPQSVSGGFSKRVRWEAMNQLSTFLLSPAFPHYRRHRAHHPLAECGGWLKRLAKRPLERRYTDRVSDFLAQAERPFYLLPLQLETDYQIRRHSGFKSMIEVMETVLESFARKAPVDAMMVVKLHPLDNGLVNCRKHAHKIARRLGLRGRVFVIDGGHLPTLLSQAQGVVVVNSTTGLSALHHHRPTKVLGRAVFDMPGLTFQGSLDRFWNEKTQPDMELFRAFRRVVVRRAQVNGSFFTEAGMTLAIEGAIARMGVVPVAVQATYVARPELEDAGMAGAESAIVFRQ